MDLTRLALVIGFGRIGQIASQFLLARGHEISIIDTDVEMIDIAREHGFDVYYGDGIRLDILRAAGAGRARVVPVCVDVATQGTRISEILKSQFPDVPVLARAIDRRHSVELVRAGVEYQIRGTFESSMAMGSTALDILGASQSEIKEILNRVRGWDDGRFKLDLEGGVMAGSALFRGKVWRAAHCTPSL